MRNKVIMMLKRGMCVVLASIFLCTQPLQVFAEEAETALPESYEGVNTEEVEVQTELTEEEFDATLTSLQATHTNAPIAPILTAPEFSQECKVAPAVSKSGRNYHVDSVTFSGTATGNGVTGIKYRKNSDEEFVEITDYTKEAEVVGTNEVLANPDDPEDDTTTTVDVTVDHITWTVTIPADQLETGKSYLPEVSYVFAETKTNEDGTEEVVESSCEFTANTFAIVSVGRGQSLSKIAKQYGTTVAAIKNDNQITSSLAPKKNSTIYITNPVLEEARNTTDVWTPELMNALTMQGEIPGMEYAYGYVSLYDGALFYSDVDFEITEQETTEVEKVFHSKAQDIEGVFGYGTSSLFDVKVIELDDNTFLFYMTDGHGVKLTKSGTNYVSADGEYTLTVSTDEENPGYRVTNQAGIFYTFDGTGSLTTYGTKKGEVYHLVYDEEVGLSQLVTAGGKTYELTTDSHGRITEIKKPDGATRSYKYNNVGLLIEETNERGKKTSFSFDNKKRLMKVVNPMGKAVANFSFNEDGSVAAYTNGENQTAKFRFDGANKSTTFTDPKNQTTTYVYDSFGRHTKITYPDGTFEERSFDNRGNTLSAKDKLGQVTSFTYDSADHILTQKNPNGTTESFTYDAMGNMVAEKDEKGHVTTYAFDEANNPIRITYADGSVSSMTFDAKHRMTSTTNPSGATITYEYEGETYNIAKVVDGNGAETVNTYDACDRLLTTTTGGKTTTYTYSPTGQKLSSTDANGNTERYEYDDADHSIGVTDPSGNRVGMRYDSMGRVTEVVNADGSSTKFSYDANGNLAKEENSDGETKTYTYDSNDELKSEKSSGGSSTSYERDAKGRVVKETDGDGDTITYKYHDTLDVVTEKKDKLGRITTYSYDKAGNLLKEIQPDGSAVIYTYDANNRMTSMLDSDGVKTEYTYSGEGNILKERQTAGTLSREKNYTYDANGNLLTETDYNGNKTTYVYDEENRLIKATDARGYSSSYIYDGLGSVLKETDRNGNITSYSYDPSGNLTSMTDPCGFVFGYQYDSEDRVTQETKPDGVKVGAVYNAEGYMSDSIDAFGNKTSYTYDDKGNVLSITDPAGNKTTYKYDVDGNNTLVTYPNGATEKHTYNKNGWLTRTIEEGGKTTTYSYDIMGNIVKVSYSNGGKATYSYDQKGNLVKEVTREGVVRNYSYDDLGNLIKFTSSAGEEVTYSYDKEGNILSQESATGAKSTYEYDAVGNLTSVTAPDGGVTKYEYDGNGNMTKIVDALGNAVLMKYDGNNNLIETTTADGVTVKATYDFAGNILTQTDGRGNTTKRSYDAMGQLTKEETPEGASFTYTYDKCGNQTSVTDGLGYKKTYAFDTMGHLVSETDPLGAKTTYSYSKEGNLENVVAANKAETKYDYDREGNLIKTTYADGTKETSEYDAANRKISETNRYGIKTTTTYNDAGLVEKITESGREGGDRIREYTYDSFGRVVKEAQTGYHPITYEYDSKDRVTATIQEARKVTMEYDQLDRVRCETDALGTKTVYEYNVAGNVSRITELPKGVKASDARVSEFVYDANGNLTETKAADGTSTKSVYDKDNRRIEETDANGNTTTYGFDKAGNVVRITDPSGKHSSYVYDGNGNVTAITDANEVVTRYGYDISGNINRVEDANGTTVYYEYDKVGNLTREITTDKNDNIEKLTGKSKRKVVDYYYNKTGDLIRVGAPTGEHEDYEYYKDGTLKKTISPSKKEIGYSYDKAGNLTGVSFNGETNVAKTFDGYGQLSSMTDSNGTTKYSYDLAGRIKDISTGAMKLSYSYDSFGNLEKLTYPDKTAVTYRHDNMGRVSSMTERSGVTIDYTYDKNSNLVEEKRSDGIERKTTFDEQNRVTSVKSTQDDKTLSAYKYTYDSAGRVVEEKSVDKLGFLDKRYSYDDCGKLTQYEEFSGQKAKGTPDKSIAYSYDLFGNRTKEVTSEAGKTTATELTYDKSDRLLSKKTNGKTTGTYEYDLDGNLISKTEDGKKTEYTYTVDNRMATVTVDGTLQQSIRYDGNGLKTFEILRKEYDATAVSEEAKKQNEKNLKAWAKYYQESAEERTEDDSYTDETVSEYAQELIVGRDYEEDAFYVASLVGCMAPPLFEEWWEFAASFGKDIKETLHVLLPGDDSKDAGEVGTTGDDRAFSSLLSSVEKPETIKTPYGIKVAYYDPTAYVYDYTQENAQVLSTYASPQIATSSDTFQYGPGGRTSSDTTGTYIYDGRGSVTETVVQSKVTNTLRYDPYGEITEGAPSQDNIFGYNGEQYTPQTGLIYLRARNYDPANGCFTSKDTYLGNKIDPVTRNRYTYANNNPVSNQDPDGHKAKKSSVAAAVRKGAAAVPKTVSRVSVSTPVKHKTTHPVTQTVQRAMTQGTKAINKATANVKRNTPTATRASANVKRVVNTAKASIVNATSAVINRATGAVGTAVRTSGSAWIDEEYSYIADTINVAKETRKNYNGSFVKTAQAVGKQMWEHQKDEFERDISLYLKAEEKTATVLQNAKNWFNEKPVGKYLAEKAEKITGVYKSAKEGFSKGYKDGVIGSQVSAVHTAISKAKEDIRNKFLSTKIGQFCEKTVSSVQKFCEEHPVVTKFVATTAIILGLAAITALTGGAAACTIPGVLAESTLMGAIDFANYGTGIGLVSGAVNYYRENGTLDGSTDYILESATGGMYSGSKTGAGVGFMSGVFNLITNPEGFCFVAGTVVMTAVGLVAIEDLQPGDVVYSMVAAGEEQQVDLSQELDRKVILETYAHEVDETYVVTIDGESIEATPEHPFYNTDGEEVQAKDLKEGDELANANGDTATVDSVECIHHDEPVMVYNIAVCDSHTYFVGENHVLVHNMCPPKKDSDIPSDPSIDKARDVAEQIRDNNGTPPNGYKGGRTFNNIPKEGAQKLPDGVGYKEYDINPYVRGQNRGAERIVMGDDGSVWYTGDHYYTFKRIE